MSIIGRFMDSMRVSDADDDDYIDDEEEYEDQPRKGLGGLLPRRSSASEDSGDEESEKPRLFTRKVTPVKRSSLEVVLVKPTGFDNAKEIVDNLLNGKAVVLNMEGFNTETAQRIIDFTSGASYSMNGKLQKISNYIFIITPDNVSLSGEFQDILSSVNASMNPGTVNISGLNIRQ